MSTPAKRTPIIHIGMPKTATKTLQWRLFNEHSEVFYLGRFDGSYFNGKYRQLECCLNQDVHTIMRDIAYKNMYNPDIPKCKELLEKVLQPAQQQNLVPVWSWESYATDILAKRRVRARNLKQVFGDAKIIMTLRHPVKLLESAYFQQLKRDNIGGRALRGRTPYYRTIDDWLNDDFYGEILPHLQYPETIEAYVNQFGKENVHVFLFEDLIQDHDKFFTDICEVMGIDAQQGIDLVKANVDNSRWTTEQIDALKAIKKSPLKSLRFTFARKRTRKKLLGLGNDGIPVKIGEKSKAPISKTWQEKIYETTLKGNMWLQDEFNLPLEKYQYIQTKDLP